MKFYPISHVVFETTRSRLIQILHHYSVSWKITRLYFWSSNLLYFAQKKPIEKKFSDFWLVGRKLTKFLMSYLKRQVFFYLNFLSLFSVMRDNSSVFTTHQIVRFQTFDCSREISPNLYFGRLLLLTVYKILAKEV